MKIVGILHCSAGNESVGDMWKETKVFDITEPIENIFKWANKDNGKISSSWHGHLEITIAQE